MSLKCNQKLHIKGTLSRRLPRSKFQTIGRAAEKARIAGDVDIGDSSWLQMLPSSNVKSMFSFLRQLTPWHYPHSTAARRAAVLQCPAAAVIDRDLLPDEPTSANLSSGVRWANGTDRRQTNRRTPDSCIDPAPNTMRVVPTIQILVILRHMVLLNKCYRNPLMHDLIYFALWDSLPWASLQTDRFRYAALKSPYNC